jgi:hypothetical protein
MLSLPSSPRFEIFGMRRMQLQVDGGQIALEYRTNHIPNRTAIATMTLNVNAAFALPLGNRGSATKSETREP